jgi:hypothetical protein
MWICLNFGFISAVQNQRDPNGLAVRARRSGVLRQLFPTIEPIKSLDTDYRWRVYVSKQQFAEVMAKQMLGIKYTNFKDSTDDHELHELYSTFWHFAYKYQRDDRDAN